jgi:thiol:disulfide interchange protein DsbD
VVCREVCLPGHGELALALPVAGDATKPSADHDLFAKAKQSLPQPMPRAWKQSAIARNDYFQLTLRTGKRVASAAFFPLEAEQIENAAPQYAYPMPAGVRFILKKSEQLLKPITRLKGVIILDGKPYEVDAPVKRQPKHSAISTQPKTALSN